MQYANSIDEWAEIMIKKNNGAYANSWLLGDIKTGEIARLELGLKNHSLEKKTNGYFAGSNITSDIKLLRQETDASLDDVRNGSVARKVRWKQLMKEHYGKIDIELAKKDARGPLRCLSSKKKNRPAEQSADIADLDDGSVPGSKSLFRPRGAVDGKVVDSDMAKNWQFAAKWGQFLRYRL